MMRLYGSEETELVATTYLSICAKFTGKGAKLETTARYSAPRARSENLGTRENKLQLTSISDTFTLPR
jgi:hypothetical protein